jgi:exodeoxyribonuclease V alpha subunit
MKHDDTTLERLVGEVTGWRSNPKADTAWHIIFVTDDDGREHTVTGCALPRVGAYVTLQGQHEDTRYGRQFHARSVVKSVPPLTAAGVTRWLAERVAGCGPKRAAALLARFDGRADALWSALEHDPASLGGAVDVPPQVIQAAHDALVAEGTDGNFQALLFGWGLTARQIAKVKQHWDLDTATEVLNANPYLLADHVAGFGFARADAVAQRMGIGPTEPVRLNAAVLHFMEAALSEGHVFADEQVFRNIAREARVSFERLMDTVRALKGAGRVVVEDGARVYLPELHAAELAIAADLRRRFAMWPRSGNDAREDVLDVSDVVIVEHAEAAATGADPWQTMAVDMLSDVTRPIAYVTGGPGTGKTSVIRQALDRLEAARVTVHLAAPTGKAAKRMTEATGRRAYTLHTLLGYRPQSTVDCDVCRDADSSFNFGALAGGGGAGDAAGGVIIVDESSMVDVRLWAALVAAGRDFALRFVGDPHQLPPVGGGQPFRDSLDVAPMPAVVKLRTVYRAKGEWVKLAAPRMLAGDVPSLEPAPGFRFIECASADAIVPAVLGVYDGAHDDAHFTAAIATAAGHMPVLAPQRTGSAGCNRINIAMQDVYNPRDPGDETPTVQLEDGTELRVRSWVMLTKNDHKKGVCNGDTGYVTAIDATGAVTVLVEGAADPARAEVPYTRAEARAEIRLAYATTVHKCVAPDTLVETSRGVMRIDELPAIGVIGTTVGALPYHGLVRNPPGPALRVVVDGGYEVTVTPEHGMMSFRGGEYRRVEARDLRVGDWLRLSLRPGADAIDAPAMPPWPEALDVRARVYRVPAHMTPELAELLGLLVADGTVFRGGFRLVKRHRDVAERFADLCRVCFGIRPHPISVEGATGYEVHSVGLVRWLRAVGGTSPNAKAVPSAVLRSPLALQARFLRGLFEDGTVHARFEHIEWSTVRPEMARTVQTMLLRFGIVCARAVRRTACFLYIYSADACRFAERIGFVSSFKQARALMAASQESRRRLVPVGRVAVALDRNANNRGYVSRRRAATLGMHDELAFHHARVVSIEPTVTESICVTVPRHGRFLQNGFDGSISQGSEYPWCVVVCHSVHKRMLTRRLLYTAITRAKDGVVLVGDRDGVAWAVKNAREVARCTWLRQRIGDGNAS